MQHDFPATRWTVVLAAKDPNSPEAHEALNRLCADYWYPLYAFVRRRGRDEHDAKDLTQAFFERLFETDALSHVRSERGKFRTFLLTALDRFLKNKWESERRFKRGGNLEFISWDFAQAEHQFAGGAVPFQDAAQNFDRDWACALVAKVMSRLREEHASAEQARVYAAISPFLTSEPGSGVFEDVAKSLNREKKTLHVALHRLRGRFGKMLRKEVSETVARPEDVDDELRNLLAALGP